MEIPGLQRTPNVKDRWRIVDLSEGRWVFCVEDRCDVDAGFLDAPHFGSEVSLGLPSQQGIKGCPVQALNLRQIRATGAEHAFRIAESLQQPAHTYRSQTREHVQYQQRLSLGH